MGARSTPTLRDIARACGLSTTAVSDAFRNKPNIPPATRDRVFAAAEQLGYSPDARLSQLMAYLRGRRGEKNAPTIAWLNSSPGERIWHTQPYKVGVLNGARRRASELGYALDELWIGNPELTLSRANQVLKARGIQGLVIPTLSWSGDEKGQIDWANFACAYVDTTARKPELSLVNVDYSENMRIALHRLREMGYRRIGLWLTLYLDDVAGNGYSSRYLYEHARWGEAHIPLPELELHGRKKLAEWVREYRPEVILCSEATLLEQLAHAGLRVPQDVAVAHMNIREDVSGWAGMSQNHEVLGAAAIDVVVAQFHRGERGLPVNPRRILIKGTWVDGWTCPPKGSASASFQPARSTASEPSKAPAATVRTRRRK